MVKRNNRRRQKSALDYVTIPEFGLDPDTKKGIFIVLIFTFGAVSLLSFFGFAGAIGFYLNKGLELLFGWGKWIITIILLALALLLYNDDKYYFRGANYLGLFLFIISFHGLLHFFIEADQWQEAIKLGNGGGYVGLLLASIFVKLMGFWAGLLVLAGLLIISLLLIFNTTLARLMGKESWLAKLLYHPFGFIYNKIFNREVEYEEDNDDEELEEDIEDEEIEDEEDDLGFSSQKVRPEPDFMDLGDKKEKIKKSLKSEWQPSHVKIDLPLSLLNDKSGKPVGGDIKNNALIIQRTLEHFGIMVEMGEASIGPTVTQYTFKPAEGVKLSRIVGLGNDLALALAAHPIRIEAPIPGKSLVGVEVPNQTKSIVSLKEILSSKEFKTRKNNLTIAIGKDVSGVPWIYDITKMPHLLVAGATGSGKSVCLNSIIISLLYQNNPDDLRFIMVDPKRVELPIYNGIPHLLTPVVTEVAKTINALKWCLNEMDRRFEVLSKSGKRNIQSYNDSKKNGNGRRENREDKMPYIVFIIDELADLMVASAREVEGAVIRLAQMSRAVGIHLVLATQRPSVDVITGLIKANMPARIAFSVASGTDSRTILDTLGADKLLGQGDMLFTTAGLSKPKRLQGTYVSETEIRKIVRFIKDKSPEPDYVESILDRQKVKGVAGVGIDRTSDDDDELLEEAKELIINSNKASASFLQRRLSIGYARAARILDILEEMGVIGQANGAKPREILISKGEYDSMSFRGPSTSSGGAISGVSLHSREKAAMPDNFLGEEDDEDIARPETPVILKPLKEDNKNKDIAIEEDEEGEDVEDAKADEEEDNKDNDKPSSVQAMESKDDIEEDEGKYFSK